MSPRTARSLPPPATRIAPRGAGSAPRRLLWRSLLQAVSWHRRKLAAVAAALAVLTGVSAAMPEGPPTTLVVTARDQLPGGRALVAADLRLREVVAADLPAGALAEPGDLIGRTLTAPVASGQVLTDLALVAPRARLPAGRVVTPLRLADSGLGPLLRPGDVLDIIAADAEGAGASIVASAVRVVTVPAVEPDAAAGSTGALVLLEVTSAVATDLARAAAAGSLTVSWR